MLAVAPFFVLFGQNYGGEASLRVVLFSSPWCAGLISWALATVTRRRLKQLLMASTVAVYTALFVPSFFGIEELNIIAPAEVRASEWFYYHAQHGSVLVLAAPGFPYRYGGTYPDFSGPEGDANPNLVSAQAFQDRQLGAAEVPYIVGRIQEYSQHGYIVFTKDQTAYAEVLGITPPGALEHLRAAVVRSPDFRLWYANKDVQIYELLEPSPRTGLRVRTRPPGAPLLQPLPTGSSTAGAVIGVVGTRAALRRHPHVRAGRHLRIVRVSGHARNGARRTSPRRTSPAPPLGGRKPGGG